MKMSCLSAGWRSVCLVVAVFGWTGGARGQEQVTGADVPEERATAVLHVNIGHPDAADENAGTSSSPLRSIGRGAELAMANNSKGIGTKILIAPGVYRDQVKLPHRGKEQTDAPMIFEAVEKGTVTLTGSDVFSEWHRVEGKENLYWHHWLHKWGPREQVKDPVWLRCGIVYRPILLRRETVYANGQLLRLVLSPLGLREGTHYVSEEDEKLVVWLPKGLDARTALMEVPIRQGLFTGERQSNVVLRGLKITHDNHYFGMASACTFYQGSRNILIEDCCFEWNNCGGYGLNTVRELTVRRVVANHNGGSGLSGCRLENILFEDTENSYNNWRGDWGEYYSWSVGGTKFLVTHRAVFRRNRSIGNHALGFWFDTDCTDILVDGAWWVHNDRAGIFIEANQGPITIRNSVLAFNGDGVTSTNSSRVVLENNVIYHNTGCQIGPMGPRDRKIRTWEWRGKEEDLTLQIQDWRLVGNVVVSATGRQPGLKLTYQDPELFLSTLTSNGNVWYSSSGDQAFSLSGVQMTLAEWQTATGKDADSQFSDPGFMDPANLNFWVSRGGQGGGTGAAAGPFDAAQGKALLLAKQEELIRKNWETPFPAASTTTSVRWFPLPLAAYVNRPQRGKDGWMGVGGLSLEWLQGGPTTIQGVPFHIVDPTNDRLSCIALRSFRVQRTGEAELPARVTVSVDRKVSALYFLHGCGWAKHATVGHYRMVYSDGTDAAIDIIPYGSGSEHLDVMERMRKQATIQDWWPGVTQVDNERLRPVIVANPENLSDKRYLYHLQWLNPTPGKLVQRIELSSDPKASTSLFVVAVTAALAE